MSLGSNCEITGNIRSYFKIEEAYPFDWWMTPYHALLKILDNNFDGLFEEQNIIVPHDKLSIIDKKYNILYHHDFERDKEGLIVTDNLELQLLHLKEKYHYLQQRFITKLSGKKILFIRNRCGNDPNYLQGDFGHLEAKHCKKICDLIINLLPNTSFDLLITNLPNFEGFQYKNSWVFSDSIIDYQDSHDYMVSPKGWGELFKRNEIELLK